MKKEEKKDGLKWVSDFSEKYGNLPIESPNKIVKKVLEKSNPKPKKKRSK